MGPFSSLSPSWSKMLASLTGGLRLQRMRLSRSSSAGKETTDWTCWSASKALTGAWTGYSTTLDLALRHRLGNRWGYRCCCKWTDTTSRWYRSGSCWANSEWTWRPWISESAVICRHRKHWPQCSFVQLKEARNLNPSNLPAESRLTGLV